MAEFTGKVVEGPFGKGSKSEHTALYLDTVDGAYVLRRKGGNPFHDETLQALIGRTIRCTGTIVNYTLILTDWEEEDA